MSNEIKTANDASAAARTGVPMTRAAFQAAQEKSQKAEQSGGTPLALVSVVLGFGQLYLLRWVSRNFAADRVPVVGGIAFVLYIAIVAVMFVRMLRARGAAAPRCPQCGVAMLDLSQRVALATGKCDRCGGRVIE